MKDEGEIRMNSLFHPSSFRLHPSVLLPAPDEVDRDACQYEQVANAGSRRRQLGKIDHDENSQA